MDDTIVAQESKVNNLFTFQAITEELVSYYIKIFTITRCYWTHKLVRNVLKIGRNFGEKID